MALAPFIVSAWCPALLELPRWAGTHETGFHCSWQHLGSPRIEAAYYGEAMGCAAGRPKVP